jgi:hypothetical protein
MFGFKMKRVLDSKIPPQKFRLRRVKSQSSKATIIYIYTYFWSVCPATGQTQATIAPYLSKDIMRQHLQLILDATPSEEYAVVIVDHASWHRDNIDEEFKNHLCYRFHVTRQNLTPLSKYGYG